MNDPSEVRDIKEFRFFSSVRRMTEEKIFHVRFRKVFRERYENLKEKFIALYINFKKLEEIGNISWLKLVSILSSLVKVLCIVNPNIPVESTLFYLSEDTVQRIYHTV